MIAVSHQKNLITPEGTKVILRAVVADAELGSIVKIHWLVAIKLTYV